MGIKCPKCQTDNPDTQKFCGECATPLPSSKDIPVTETLETPKEELTTGSTIAERYQIIEELGKGGMGKVYKAHDTEINEKVAIKLIKPEVAADKKTIERFRNELKFARKIRHKNVCQMYDLGEEKGTRYITMEYVPGEDLKRLIRKVGQLGVGKTISIAKQMCEGLAEAHRLGVIHRDLKPRNIMVDEEGNARIMDFGIARSVKGKGITGAGVIIGTPEYMSPEHVEGKEADQRSDIYSLGVILYEMVTGRVPFEGEAPLGIAMKHKSETPKDPMEINAQIPEDLSQMIMKCMEKDKEIRYQSAGEVRSELENIEKRIPSTERIVPKRKPITSREITVTFGLKRLFIPAIVIIALVIAAVITWQILPQKEVGPLPSDKPSIAVLPFTDLSPQKDKEYFCDGMTEEIIAKLSMIVGLKVISRTSVMRYKNVDKDIKEIGRELGVESILEGSIRRENDDIRITAQLINVEDSFHLWSDIYNRKIERVFEVQSNVAEKIITALKEKLSPEEEERLRRNPTKSIEAYEYYLKGMHFLKSKYEVSGKEEDLMIAMSMFEKAAEIDEKYALAYYGLAWAYMDRFNITQDRKELDLSIENCETAYKLDSNLAESNAAMGTVYLVRVELDKAYQSYKRALKIKPNSSIINQEAGGFLRNIGLFHQAIKYYSKAVELDPFHTTLYIKLAWSFMETGKFDEALIYLEKALELEPNNLSALEKYTELLITTKEYDKAVETLARIEKINPEYSGVSYYRALLCAAKREKEEALALRKSGVVYSLLGMKDEAIKFLQDVFEKGYLAYAYSYLFLKTSPFFDNLRDDPRFEEILNKQKKRYEEYLKKYGDL